jgi:hypothetical protein
LEIAAMKTVLLSLPWSSKLESLQVVGNAEKLFRSSVPTEKKLSKKKSSTGVQVEQLFVIWMNLSHLFFERT